MCLFSVGLLYPRSWEGLTKIVSAKSTNFSNRLGYGNGDRIWYLTLFGWEKGKRLAYFTSDR